MKLIIYWIVCKSMMKHKNQFPANKIQLEKIVN